MEDMLGLAGKVAIVWGGGQSMGEAYALRLARAGCDVAVVDLVEERAETVAKEVRELGRRSIGVAANARDADSVEAAVDRTERELGPLKAMATIIGAAQHWTPVLEMSLDKFRDDASLNLETFFLTAQACARCSGVRTCAIFSPMSIRASSAAASAWAIAVFSSSIFA